MKQQEETRRPRSIVSAVTEEGVLVESVLDPTTKRTALVVSRNGDVSVHDQWNSDAGPFVPVSATNNLIVHGALVLPSAVGEYATEDALHGELREHIARFVTLSPDDLDIVATYVMLTWVYDAFNELPYLRFRGDYGTGKTRALLVVGSLCYKAFFASGASTVSPIFHTLDSFRGTLVFDEADFRFTDEKSELVKILNNGNVRGFPVLRTQLAPNKEFDPRAFLVYGPKLVAMRGDYHDKGLESRFLTIEMEPGRGSSPINLPDEHAGYSMELRNKLLSYRLRTRMQVSLNPSLADRTLEPRMNQILLPLLSIAPVADIRLSLLDRARRSQRRIVSERSGTPEGHALSVLCALGRDGDQNMALADVVRSFTEEYGGEYDRPITNRYVGGVLRRLGISLYKKHGVFVVSPGQAERIHALARRFGVGDISRADDENHS